MRRAKSTTIWTALLVLALSSTPADSQQATAPSVLAPYIRPATSVGCPVRYSAFRYGLSATLRETAGGPVRQYAQSLRILLDPDAARKIRSVVGLVHGGDGSLQALPAQFGPWPKLKARSFDRTEPFEFNERGNGLDGVQYIYTNSIPLITSIEITTIQFRDGSIWWKSPSRTCSVAPSPFVLVNASAN